MQCFDCFVMPFVVLWDKTTRVYFFTPNSVLLSSEMGSFILSKRWLYGWFNHPEKEKYTEGALRIGFNTHWGVV